MLTPENLLQAGTYELVLNTPEPSDFFPPRSFEVTGEIDETPPAPPIIESTKSRWSAAHRTCEEHYNATFEISNIDALLLADEDADMSEERAEELRGPYDAVMTETGEVFFSFGSGCGVNLGANQGDEVTVRFGTYDLAGNFSGWTEPQAATVGSQDSGGCSVVGGNVAPNALNQTAAGFVALAGLGLAWARRARGSRG